MLKKLFKEQLSTLIGTTISINIFDTKDSPTTEVVVDEKINFSTFVEELKETICTKTNGEFQLEKVEYKRNGFGFSYGYATFCHTSRVVGTKTSLETLCMNNTLFVIHSYMNDKGRQASWLCPIDEIDEKTQNILTPFVKEAIIKVACEKAADIAREQYWQQEEAREAAKKAAELAKLGINDVKKIVIDERDNYGGKKEYKFLFNPQIDEETFKKFLQLEGLKVEAKKCSYPISPEVVEYYPIIGGWKYKWVGEWDD